MFGNDKTILSVCCSSLFTSRACATAMKALFVKPSALDTLILRGWRRTNNAQIETTNGTTGIVWSEKQTCVLLGPAACMNKASLRHLSVSLQAGTSAPQRISAFVFFFQANRRDTNTRPSHDTRTSQTPSFSNPDVEPATDCAAFDCFKVATASLARFDCLTGFSRSRSQRRSLVMSRFACFIHISDFQ